MHGRRLACLLALALPFLPAYAEDAPKLPFIVRTHVVAPHKVDAFVMERTTYDPGNRLAGVGIRYLLPDRQELRIDLFVYPHGQSDTRQALEQGMRDFSASMQPAVDAGVYRNVVEGDVVEFNVLLPRTGSDRSPVPTAGDDAPAQQAAEREAEEHRDDDGRLSMLAELLETAEQVDGRRMDLGYELKGQAEGEWIPMRSRTYLFYRHLYYFKGRISAAQSRIDHDSFSDLADHAMRELVPAVQAYNIGSCGDTTVYVNTDAPEEERMNALLRDLVAAQVRSEARNCHPDPDEEEVAALARDADVVTIEYPPEAWSEE